MVDYNGLAGTESFGKGYDQANGILSNYNNRKAALQAGDAYAGGNVTGAAGILARNGQLDQARTLNQDAAEQAAAAKKAQQEQASHAVTAMVNMAQGLKQVPAEKRSEAFQKVIAPLLQQQGVNPAQIQQMGQSDFSDQTLDTTIAALGQEGKKYQLANGGDGYFGSFDQSSGTLKTLREAQPSYQPVTVEDANGNKAVIPFNKSDPYGSGAGPTQAPQAQGAAPAGTRGQRNNNPGNLKWDGRSKWQGMTGVDPQGFVIFDTPDNGVRAAGINLQTQASRGPQTLTSLITKYAPASDNNDTQAYITSVAQQTGLDPSAQIDLTDPAIRQKVMDAMFRVENGGTPVRAPSPPVDAGGASPTDGGMRPIYSAPGFGGPKQPDTRPATAQEKADFGIDPSIPAQIDKSGKVSVISGTSARTKPMTEGQAKAGFNASRMIESSNVLDRFEQSGFDGSLAGAGEVFMDSKSRIYQAAKKQWADALIRETTGAAATESEVKAVDTTYFPQPGDNPDVRARKAEMRRAAQENTFKIAGEAGQQAFGKPTSSAPQTKRPSLDDIFK